MGNNELENTLLVFTLSSTLFIIRGCRAKHNIEAIFCGLISVVFIILAFLSKGVFALYPLVFPFFCYFFLENANKKKAIACQISLLFSTLILFIPFILNESSYNFFKIYFEQQVYRSLSGHREVDNPHFEIFIVLLKEIIVPISLCFAIVAFSKSMKLFNFNRTTVLYFFMALAASLPLVISSKNHGWYIMISMPFYALAIASLFINYLIEFKDWCIRTRGGSLFLYSLVISLSCVAIILSIRNYNRVLKNAQYHNDFTMQGKMLLENTVISFFPQWLRGKGETWMMLGNFARDYKISLSLNPNLRFRLFLVNDPEAIEVPKECRLFFPKNPKEFAVYDCIEDSSMSLLSENNEILLNSEAQT